VPVHLDVVADRADLLEMKPEQIEAHRRSCGRHTSYGSHHYDHYDLLLALTDHTAASVSSTIGRARTPRSPITSLTGTASDTRDLLAHEFTHSWNGKFRRPRISGRRTTTADARQPAVVYEGQTHTGVVSRPRGLLTKQQALDALASTAATYDSRIGRQWRALQDTTNDPVAALRRPLAWRSWERSEDYYSEGQLVWLDVDTLIRERSANRRSLDDFARTFFGVNDGSYVPLTYAFEDVVKALNVVEPYDWAALLRARLDGHGPGAPLDGVARGGYNRTPKHLLTTSARAKSVGR
jgi:predicted metalloprotease with PDZ domain